MAGKVKSLFESYGYSGPASGRVRFLSGLSSAERGAFETERRQFQPEYKIAQIVGSDTPQVNRTFNSAANLNLLRQIGFKGSVGGGAGERFLNTLPLEQQLDYVVKRRALGDTKYIRAGITESQVSQFQQEQGLQNLTADLYGLKAPALSDIDIQAAADKEATELARRKGRRATIFSDLSQQEANPENLQRRSLVGA